MRISEVAKAKGWSRQWLNKHQKRDGVPGIARGHNGRLQITDRVALERWLNPDPLIKAARYVRRAFRGTPKIGDLVAKRHRDCKIAEATWWLLEPHLSEERWPEFKRIFCGPPVQEALRRLRADERFRSVKEFPVIPWIVAARTERNFRLRRAVAQYAYARDHGGYHSKVEIAKKLGVTRAAVTRIFYQMPRIDGISPTVRGWSDHCRRRMQRAANRRWRKRRITHSAGQSLYPQCQAA
jgi:hypothetical protein